jgi:hypothetical protein
MRAAPSDRAFALRAEPLRVSSVPASIPAAHLDEAIALLSHPDARSHLLELEAWPSGDYGARIWPPYRQHLRAVSPLSGSFYGVASTPRAALLEAIAKAELDAANAARWAAANKDMIA